MGSTVLVAVLALSFFASSCSPKLIPRADDAKAYSHKCSESPKGAVVTFLRGMAELSLTLLRAVVTPGASLWAIFGDGDTRRGRELVLQMTTHPEIPDGDRGCVCSLLEIEDTSNPHEKVITIKRETLVGDDERDYKRTFLVRFSPEGNCIEGVKALDQQWQRLQ